MGQFEMRRLGCTDLQVPSLCLGTMMFGDQIGEGEAFLQMDRCLDRGVNFFDTAELYTVPPKQETQGESERIVGRWMAQRGVRDKIVLATKVVGRSTNKWLRPEGTPRVRAADINFAVERSLENLQTDYIDLYQVHWPEREVAIFGQELKGFRVHQNDDATSIDEQLQALGRLVADGKVRHIGLSNETPWGVMSFLRAAKEHGLPEVVSVQNAYSLVNRSFEYGLAEIAMEEGVGLLAYSPLGQGVLSGKYIGGNLPAGSRRALYGRFDRYETPNAPPAISAYVALAKELGFDPSAFALQFVTTRPWVTSNIFGASNQAQLDTVFASIEIDWTDEIQARVDQIHVQYPNPSP